MSNRLTNRQIGNVIRKIYARQREASQGYTKEQRDRNELLCEKFGDGHHLTANIYEVISKIKINNNMKKTEKTVGNTTSSQAKKNVKDIVFWGDGDTFKLISKASSKAEGWLKSTKAMEIEGVGCVIQVTTQQGDNVAEAVTFVPKTRIVETTNAKGEVISRKIVSKKFVNPF
jgi:hypothetical protein